MNSWLKVILTLSLVTALLLTAAWRHYVYVPMQTQAKFTALMEDAAPFLKRRKPERRAQVAASIGILLDTAPVGETAEKKAERLSAKKQLDAAVKNAAPQTADVDFQSYKDKLEGLDQRFAALNHDHLAPCQSEDAYRHWGTLRIWEAWAKHHSGFVQNPNDSIANYEVDAVQYTGRPVTLSEIKAVGDAEYTEVTAQLIKLAAEVQSNFGLSLDSFALRPENFSSSEAGILARSAPLLASIEAKFAALRDFDFAPVPPANIQTQEGFGPRYTIASYIKNDNAMRLYWANGRYNHIYDTMLAVHEIMPGHHLQMRMSRRRACGIGPISAPTAILEGWATYAEILADERGLFDAPDQRLGWLDYRLVRAMRIIMDTARIEDGLSKDDAWALWLEKMPRRLDEDFPREWARINSSPHHLSYIFGSQAILQARERIRDKMQENFNEAEFHAAFLNAYHQHLLFLADRLDAQIKARKRLDTPVAHEAEAAL